ncbi:hypothetical protein [Acidovorax sp.]|uniref:hypothetical protein n=1 Tax=Acidovorax sp. TaxID=1872122 RepID=UPI00391F5845
MNSMDIIPFNREEPEAERISRFQSLQAGQYWKALHEIPEEGIEGGTTLLIQSIRLVDDAPHTVILRPHPLKIGRQVQLNIPREDGSVRKSWFEYDEHRFLLKDFLAAFEFEPDHQIIRSKELQAVQGRIGEIQQELVQGQTDPVRLAAIVQDGLAEQAKEQPDPAEDDEDETDGDEVEVDNTPPGPVVAANLPAAIPGPDDAMVALATGTVADAIAGGVNTENIEALKIAAAREHSIATIKAKWIQSKTNEIASTIKQLTPFYEEQAAAALAQTEDVRAYVDELLRGIQSLDLYLGKDVEVLRICEGESAPKDVPLTIKQAKLCMDQELCVWADVDERFDFESEDQFFKALREHHGLVEQVFPTERSILVMCVTSRYINYGDSPMASAMRNAENKKVFLLVRDGMNIFRVFSGVESHLGAARLFPNQNDQDKIFRGLDGSRIKFEDVAYTDRLSEHEMFALHYRRFLLLACGLDHRLKLFGDFYDGPQSMHFVSLDFQQRYMRFLHDDDASTAIAGGPDRPTFREWVAATNGYLRSGSRVLCNWNDLMNPATAPGACRDNQNYRYGRGYEFTSVPQKKVECAIAYKDADAVCVDCTVKKDSYRSDRVFNCKVAITKFKQSGYGSSQVPYLVLDAVDPEDLRWYIQHRATRVNHLEYIRFFKRALKLVEADRAKEADSRRRLGIALAEGGIGDPAERPAIIDRAVIAWRAANRGRDLPTFQGDAAPAGWKALLDQMFVLAGEGDQQTRSSEIEAFVRDLGYEPLRLVLSGGAKLVIYAAPKASERDDRVEPHMWVHRITVERGKTKVLEKARRWALLPAQAASETSLVEWEDPDGWVGRQSVFGSFERKLQILGQAEGFQAQLQPFLETMSDDEFASHYKEWGAARDELLRGSRLVRTLRLAIPIGVWLSDGELQYICLGNSRPHALLNRLAPNQHAKNALRAKFCKSFEKPSEAARHFASPDDGRGGWTLETVSAAQYNARGSIYVHRNLGVSSEALLGKSVSPLLADWYANWLAEKDRGNRVWIAPRAIDEAGRLNLDRPLSISLPADYDPVEIIEIALRPHSADNGVTSPYMHWFDIRLAAAPNAAKGRVSMFHDAHSKEMDLLTSEAAKAFNGHVGYGSSCQRVTSLAVARRKIAAEHPGATLASALEGAPQPPTGFERWYVLGDEDSDDE